MRDFVRGRIADYKTPERVIPTRPPQGLTGKVQRSALKDLAEIGAGRLPQPATQLTLIPSTAQKISLENRISMIECGHRSRISE